MAIQVGLTLGNYKLIRHLSSGGFGDVYLGENIAISSMQAAIKVLHGKFSPQAIQDFKNEAATIGKLKHMNIVPLLDFGEHAGVFYMVMEYAANGTLEDRHPKGSQIPLVTVISYVNQIAEALQYTHGSKIVHRDIKPANIFVEHNNEIMVGDFGIAVVAHRTQTMQLQVPLGTLGYAAPEQAKGQARPESDQYALGIMVCEWLSGMSPPFPAGIKIPGIAPAVEQVIFKALENDPKQRYPRIEDFADALEKASNPPLPQAAVLQQNVVAPTQPASPPIPQLQGLSPAERLYREGILAKSAGDIERAASLWEQALISQGYSYWGTNDLLRGLAPQRIALRVQQAREAKPVGDWQREIDIWNEIIAIKRVYYFGGAYSNEDKYRYKDEKRKIGRASQNLEYKWLYEHAQQLINNGDRDAAKATLKMLWQQAPSYGDPLGLAKQAGTAVPIDPYVIDKLRSFLLPISFAGMFFSSFFLVIALLLTLLSPVIYWANDLIGYHRHGSIPAQPFVALLIADFFFFVLLLFTKDKRA